jgi:membrane glycosyltransferase
MSRRQQYFLSSPPENTARKSGNIEDWIKRFGAGYDHMIILDADSLMTGDTIVRLVSAMEGHPGVALIQTLPIVVNARTLFARLQQFSGRLYGPLIAAGIAWWHGSEGNYWGHNAIIRVRAFAQDAGLPDLKGRKPFGGHILSHDFVEAALMRRGGWASEWRQLGRQLRGMPAVAAGFRRARPAMVPGQPSTSGGAPGARPALGIAASSSHRDRLISHGAALAAVSGARNPDLVAGQFVRPEYFPKGFSLFPKWPAQDPILAAWVFVGTMGLLIVPKLLAYVLLATQTETEAIRRRRWLFCRARDRDVSVGPDRAGDDDLSISAVGEILLGRDAGWQVQRRDDGEWPREELIRKYAVPTLLVSRWRPARSRSHCRCCSGWRRSLSACCFAFQSRCCLRSVLIPIPDYFALPSRRRRLRFWFAQTNWRTHFRRGHRTPVARAAQ